MTETELEAPMVAFEVRKCEQKTSEKTKQEFLRIQIGGGDWFTAFFKDNPNCSPETEDQDAVVPKKGETAQSVSDRAGRRAAGPVPTRKSQATSPPLRFPGPPSSQELSTLESCCWIVAPPLSAREGTQRPSSAARESGGTAAAGLAMSTAHAATILTALRTTA